MKSENQKSQEIVSEKNTKKNAPVGITVRLLKTKEKDKNIKSS